MKHLREDDIKPTVNSNRMINTPVTSAAPDSLNKCSDLKSCRLRSNSEKRCLTKQKLNVETWSLLASEMSGCVSYRAADQVTQDGR